MKALVLCAGLGTRMRPLTEFWPKPAMPLLGQPLLRYALSVLKKAGVTDLAINTHHLPEVMERTARAEAGRQGMPLRVSHEPKIQGTGGGIRGLRSFLTDETFVVWNGDIVFALDLAAAVKEHKASGAASTMVVMPMPPGEKYASVEVDPSGSVVRIAGQGPGAPKATPWHFTGVHILSPVVFDFMAPDGEEDINRSVYPKMIEKGLLVRAAKVDVYWSDLGTPARYLATQQAILEERVSLEPSPFGGAARRGNAWYAEGASAGAAKGPALFDRNSRADGEIGSNVYVGVGAQVPKGARLERSAILEGTRVAPGEQLLDTIAWGDRRLSSRGTA